jgi:hypothetical protein
MQHNKAVREELEGPKKELLWMMKIVCDEVMTFAFGG